MFGLATIAELLLLVLLVRILCRKRSKRLLTKRRGLTEWTGKGIDVAPLRPKVEAVRRNPLAGRPAPRGWCFHRSLLAFSRRSVLRFAYFHHHDAEDRLHTHWDGNRTT